MSHVSNWIRLEGHFHIYVCILQHQLGGYEHILYCSNAHLGGMWLPVVVLDCNSELWEGLSYGATVLWNHTPCKQALVSPLPVALSLCSSRQQYINPTAHIRCEYCIKIQSILILEFLPHSIPSVYMHNILLWQYVWAKLKIGILIISWSVRDGGSKVQPYLHNNQRFKGKIKF